MFDDFDAGTKRAVLRLCRASDDVAEQSLRLHRILRPLARPAFVLWGAHDPYLPVAYAARQRETFPNARVVVLEDSGHWPFADNPDRVAQEVVPFLRDLTESKGSDPST